MTKKHEPIEDEQDLMSLENEPWLRLRKSAEAVLQQVLTSAYQRLGIAHHFTEHGVAISAYSRDHIMLHSDGLKSIQKNLAAKGRSLDKASAAERSAANFEERKSKRMFPVERMREMWVARTVDAGFPVFEQGDKRLEHGFAMVEAMDARQAIDAGFALGQAKGDKVFDERKLIELSIKASSYSTPHQAIRSEITRQIQDNELIFKRGELQRAGQNKSHDQEKRQVSPPAPLRNYQQACEIIAAAEASSGHPGLLGQSERNGLINAMCGTSSTAIACQSPLSQPVLAASLNAAANPNAVEVQRLKPLSHMEFGDIGSSTTAAESVAIRNRLPAKPGAIVVLEHAQGCTDATRERLHLLAGNYRSKVVELYDQGHSPTLLPKGQLRESDFALAYSPSTNLRAAQERGKATTVISQAVGIKMLSDELLASRLRGRATQVITATKSDASSVNAAIATSIATSGQKTASLKTVRKAPKGKKTDAKSTGTYKVGDSLRIRRTTGALRRGEYATINSINEKAGFLNLSVGSRSITLSLSSQAHHIERVELGEHLVTEGSRVQFIEPLLSAGIEPGDVATVSKIGPEAVRLEANTKTVSINPNGWPLAISPADALCASDISHFAAQDASKRNVEPVVFLGSGANDQECSKAITTAHSISPDAKVIFDECLAKSPAPSQSQEPVRERKQAPDSKIKMRRLVVHEGDLESLRSAQSALEDAATPLNVTFVPAQGRRKLHRVADKASAEPVLGILKGLIGGLVPVRSKGIELDR